MKRNTFLLPLLAFAAGLPATLRADIHINWSSGTGSITQSGGVDYAPATWMVQLIYAGSDDVKAPLNPAAPLVPGGDDRVLRTQRLNTLSTDGIAGRIYAPPPLVFTDAAMLGHRVYTRVFNVVYTGLPDQGTPSGTPTFYGDSALSAPMQVATVSPTSILAHSPVITAGRSTAQPQSVPIATNGGAGAPTLVSFNATTGFLYYLETTQNLIAGPWTEISGPHTGNGPVSLSIPAGLPTPSYLRVRTE